jgi:predicted permease
LLTGAGLLIRTFEYLHNLNPGFDAERVVTFTIDPPVLYTPGMAIESLQKLTVSFFDTLQERIRETPGVASFALAAKGVMRDRGMGTTVAPVGERTSQADLLSTGANYVTQDYFETMGIRFLEGHLSKISPFNPPKPEPVVVSEAFVRRYFPDVEPIGKRFGAAGPGQAPTGDMEITGVVSDAKYRSLREPILPIIYHPYVYGEGAVVLHVRTRVKPESMIQPLRRVLAAFDPSMPIIEVDTLADEVDASSSGERLTATLGAIFAILALLLSAAGIYGLLAYAVTQRHREIGIRMALGATPGDVHELIGRQALGIVIGGVILGLAAARVTSPLIASLLYGIAPQDLRSLGGAALAVLAMAAVAAAIPAIRAARINPAIALRDDQ